MSWFTERFIITTLQSITFEVTQCAQISMHLITLSNDAGLGVPPYYMIAAVPTGVPIINTLGSNPANLIWQVGYPSGKDT